MSAERAADARGWTVADLTLHFGPILHVRIRQSPPPGLAVEQDAIDIYERERRLFELIDGVLVEKIMGVQEAYLAALIVQVLGEFLRTHDLGFILGADGMSRLAPGLIRIPDVSFISWNRVPDRKVPRVAVLGVAPDLAVEVLSPGNTDEEMSRKRLDYFAAGVRVVWFVDAARRTVRVFTGVEESTLLSETEVLEGGAVLPGFTVALRELFGRLED